jgi:hypothetical protein
MANGYSTNFESLTQVLGSLGYDMSALTSPGSLYGFGQGTNYGTEYDMYFQPFDVAGFQEAQGSLRQLEENLLSNVSQQFSQQTQDLRQRYGGTMEEIRAQSGQTGLMGGAAQRQRRTASRVGTQEQRGLIQQRESGMQSVQENIGTRLGQLEGTLLDFLGSQAQMALNIKSFDPTGGTGGKMTTQQDIDNLMRNLSSEQRSAFSSIATPLIGQPYQITLDAFKDYMGNQQDQEY